MNQKIENAKIILNELEISLNTGKEPLLPISTLHTLIRDYLLLKEKEEKTLKEVLKPTNSHKISS